jgi:hypothetical protein
MYLYLGKMKKMSVAIYEGAFRNSSKESKHVIKKGDATLELYAMSFMPLYAILVE